MSTASAIGQWTDEELLALTFLRGVSGAAYRRLVEQHTCLKDLEERGLPSRLRGRLEQDGLFAGSAFARLREQARRQMELCERAGVELLPYWDARYPPLLRHIHYPPVMLFLKGTLENERVALAVVGTRRCSSYGRQCAERFAQAFARAGADVVSGLAYGIDEAAHRATLRAGGRTVAVPASGLDSIQPALAAWLAEEIAGGGAVLSEQRCGMRAMPAYFPQRNRIIVGMCRATLVVESAERGGAMISAQFASDENRDLFAVPGPITSESSRGTNLLIRRNQAAAAIGPEDMLQDLGLRPPAARAEPELSDSERALVALLEGESRHIDELVSASGRSVQDLLVSLLDLEFRGIVIQEPGKYFRRG